MGGTESKKKEEIFEAYGYTLAEALNSLEAFLIARHQARLKKDTVGHLYVQGREDKFFVQYQTIETLQTKVYRAFFRTSISKEIRPKV
jgi:hypothetical protein